jgi:hypothetical protein
MALKNTIINIAMKKALFFILLTLPALSSFAQKSTKVTMYGEVFELPNRNIYIEGSAEVNTHRTYFLDNFKMEAASLGFTVVNSRGEAGYTFRFESLRYEGEFIVLITLILNEGNVEIVNFGWPYSTLDEMYEYNQFVFFRAVVLIPGIDEEELKTYMAQDKVDNKWQNQRFSLRLSYDYPVSFYELQPDGLLGGVGVTTGPDVIMPYTMPLNHYVIALPALTAGIDVQLMKFLGIEANIHAKLGEPNNNWVLNLMAGAQLKVPIRFSNIMLEPYGAFRYYLPSALPKLSMQINSGQANGSEGFDKFPTYFAGGGVQIGVKGGKTGSFFFDANYMFALDGNAVLNNMYGDLFSVPSVFHFKHYVVGIGVGYKFGFGGK